MGKENVGKIFSCHSIVASIVAVKFRLAVGLGWVRKMERKEELCPFCLEYADKNAL